MNNKNLLDGIVSLNDVVCDELHLSMRMGEMLVEFLLAYLEHYDRERYAAALYWERAAFLISNRAFAASWRTSPVPTGSNYGAWETRPTTKGTSSGLSWTERTSAA